MKITFFSSQPYDRSFFEKFNDSTGFELQFLDVALNEHTAVMAKNAIAVCVFVNDQVTAAVIQQLADKSLKNNFSSCSYTSIPKAPICPFFKAPMTDFVSIKPPLPVLISIAPGFI